MTLSGIVKGLGEYFLGTETRKFYDLQEARIQEFFEGDTSKVIRSVRNTKDLTILFGRYLIDFYTISLGSAAVTDLVNHRYKNACIMGGLCLGSEALRVIGILNDRIGRAFYNQYTSITDPEDTVDKVLADIEEKWKDEGWKKPTD